MLPTIHTGDRILVNKLAYGFRLPFTHTFLLETANPSPGDVVVLIAPDGTTVLLKRVIAGPGDTVAIREGRVWLNGQPLAIQESPLGLTEVMGSKPHPVRLTHGGGPDYGPLTLPEGRYLVVGDNRGDSRDGRIFGLVERNAIFGRALGCFFRDGSVGWHPL
jgi:signal peptidase I